MGQLRIGNSVLSVEGIRPLKNDVKLDDAALKNQLQKDGFDEIIYKKGDQLFIAYQKNMDVSKLSLNLDKNAFDPNSAYDAGQLSVDGDAVEVLYVDDENKSSLWAAPYKSVASGVKSMINDPYGKAALLGFVGGAATVVTKRNLQLGDGYKLAANPTHSKVLTGTIVGTSLGTVAGGLKAASETGDGSSLVAAAAGYGAGALAGWGGDLLVKAVKENPKVAAITVGVTALVVGTGVAMDYISDNSKPATYRVINKIADK